MFKNLYVNVSLIMIICDSIWCYMCYITAWVRNELAAASGVAEVVGEAGGRWLFGMGMGSGDGHVWGKRNEEKRKSHACVQRFSTPWFTLVVASTMRAEEAWECRKSSASYSHSSTRKPADSEVLRWKSWVTEWSTYLKSCCFLLHEIVAKLALELHEE